MAADASGVATVVAILGGASVAAAAAGALGGGGGAEPQAEAVPRHHAVAVARLAPGLRGGRCDGFCRLGRRRGRRR